MKTPAFELISFDLCPYVQRSIITLKHKNVPFTARKVDLENPPEWFSKISPMGKVPVLVIDEKTVLFESAVINEYLDDVTEPRLNPADPLQRALERSWIEYGSDLLMQLYTLSHEEDSVAAVAGKKELYESLEKLEPVLSQGPFFRGADFSLVDSSYAPFFLRLQLSGKLWNNSAWEKMPKVKQWAKTLIEHPSVVASKPEGFEEKFKAYMKDIKSWLY